MDALLGVFGANRIVHTVQSPPPPSLELASMTARRTRLP
jgi:hypothetical protein